MHELVLRLLATARRFYHKREIEASLRHYRSRTRGDAGEKQSFSDSGTFRSQVDRLFTLGSAHETSELERVATAAVNLCISNRYYRAADLLSDVVDALESHTWLGPDPLGEAPIQELEAHARKAKLSVVRGAWLVPTKVAAVESVVAGFAAAVGRRAPYRAVADVERSVARLVALLDQTEVIFMERRLRRRLDDWAAADGDLRARISEPAAALDGCVALLEGRDTGDDLANLRTRSPSQPRRLATLVPEDRQHMLAFAIERLGSW